MLKFAYLYNISRTILKNIPKFKHRAENVFSNQEAKSKILNIFDKYIL